MSYLSRKAKSKNLSVIILIAAVSLAVGLLVVFGRTFASSSASSANGTDVSARPDHPKGELSPAVAQELENKIQSLSSPDPRSNPAWRPVTVTEDEANSFLKYRGPEFLPPAVHDPQIRISADHISGEADVDFDQINQQAAKTGDWGSRIFSAIFSGKQRVTATGKLETGNGQGKVTIENAAVGSTAIPQVLLDWLVQTYVQQRYKIDLSKPFLLPDHVTRIELSSGRAVFLRSPDKAAH